MSNAHLVLGSTFVIGEPLGRTSVHLESGVGVAPYEQEAELLAALGAQRSGLPVAEYSMARCTSTSR